MSKKENKGFSLVETIVVIAIIAVIISVLAPTYIKYVEKARKVSDMENMAKICEVLNVINAENNCEILSGEYAYVAVYPDSPLDCGVSIGDKGALLNELKAYGIYDDNVRIKSRNSPWKDGYVVFYSFDSASTWIRAVSVNSKTGGKTLMGYDYTRDELYTVNE